MLHGPLARALEDVARFVEFTSCEGRLGPIDRMAVSRERVDGTPQSRNSFLIIA
jgi:hypothetical protein